MKKAIALIFCLGMLSMGYVREGHTPLPGEQEPPYEVVPLASPDRLITEIDYFDDAAYEIAKILGARGVSDSVAELLSLSQIILNKASEIDVPPSLILAVIEVESDFDPCAISKVGAKGLMQVMPDRILGYQRSRAEYAFSDYLFYDPAWNLNFGIDYLGEMIEMFGSWDKALSAYNQGPTRLMEKMKREPYRGSRYARKVIAREKRFERAL